MYVVIDLLIHAIDKGWTLDTVYQLPPDTLPSLNPGLGISCVAKVPANSAGH